MDTSKFIAHSSLAASYHQLNGIRSCRLCTDLSTLIQERADMEKSYAKSLKAWSKKWGDLIEKGELTIISIVWQVRQRDCADWQPDWWGCDKVLLSMFALPLQKPWISSYRFATYEYVCFSAGVSIQTILLLSPCVGDVPRFLFSHFAHSSNIWSVLSF